MTSSLSTVSTATIIGYTLVISSILLNIVTITSALSNKSTAKSITNNRRSSSSSNSNNGNDDSKKKGSFLLKADKVLPKDNTLNSKIGCELIEKRDRQMGPNVSVFYRGDAGLVITQGKGCYMIDVDGNQHLDCCNNVASCGHAHPDVVAAGCAELRCIQTNGRFLHPTRQRYLTKLLETLPSELNTVYLVNSGSEANDLALRIAREHTSAGKPKDVICIDSAYHGHTQSLVDISPYKWYQCTNGDNLQPDTTHVVDLPDCFRGKYRGTPSEELGKKYADDVAKVVKDNNGIGTFICESIIGCGGQVVPPPGYLKNVYEVVRQYGGVCIADEVQTGFARNGNHFWEFQSHGVVPDIVTCGKPMGNGYPVAAVICRREFAESFASTGIEYFNTFGGNSVACSIAEAVIDTIKRDNLQDNALQVGNYLTQRLQSLLVNDWVGDVRGHGLFQGIEFVKSRSDSDNLQPYPELTKFIVDYLRYKRVVVSRDGPDENVIKVKPPLVFSKENVDTLVDTMADALNEAKKTGTF